MEETMSKRHHRLARFGREESAIADCAGLRFRPEAEGFACWFGGGVGDSEVLCVALLLRKVRSISFAKLLNSCVS